MLNHVLARTMQLLHPFMPFISEEIWQHLPHRGESIMVSSWPVPDPAFLDPAAEAEMDLMAIVRAVRNIRAEVGVAPGKKISAGILAPPAKAGLPA